MKYRSRNRRSSTFSITVILFGLMLATLLIALERPIVTGIDPVDAVFAWIYSDAGTYGAGLPDAVQTVADGEIQVHIIDVGQGDSILIMAPQANVLIDSGEAEAQKELLAYIRRQGVKRIDYLINSHPHSDHMGGLGYMVKNLDIGAVLMPKIPEELTPTTSSFFRFLQEVQNKDLAVTNPTPGDHYDLGEGAAIEILGPLRAYDNLNDNSLVCRLTYGDTAFLFTGDMEKTAEADLILSGAALKANILKAGHHGSSTSSTEAFVALVRPQALAISLGIDNPYGHPHREVLTLFHALGIPIYRTDLNGHIVFISDGNTVRAVSQR